MYTLLYCYILYSPNTEYTLFIPIPLYSYTYRIYTQDARQEQIIRDKDAVIQQREDDIVDLKIKMDDMAEEFNQMLKVSIQLFTHIKLPCTILVNTFSLPGAYIVHTYIILLYV